MHHSSKKESNLLLICKRNRIYGLPYVLIQFILLNSFKIISEYQRVNLFGSFDALHMLQFPFVESIMSLSSLGVRGDV
jgi:hypothetical protein